MAFKVFKAQKDLTTLEGFFTSGTTFYIDENDLENYPANWGATDDVNDLGWVHAPGDMPVATYDLLQMDSMKAWSVLRNSWYGLQLDNNDNLKVASPVKGAPATAFTLGNPATAQSGVIDARGAIGIIIDASGLTWTAGTEYIKVIGSVDNSVFGDSWGWNGSSVGQHTWNVVSQLTCRVQTFFPIADYIKIDASGGANVIGPLKYQLIY
ncbi:MAG: hypothetical protein JRN22_01900 [Nitrososphaerota archaeon]|nr:hypothetical protein [Nitrososphaerota archaeon]